MRLARNLNQWILASARNVDGSITVLVAICLTTLAGAAGIAIDYGRAVNARLVLQQAADAAALAAARDTSMTNTQVDNLVAASMQVNAKSNLFKATPTANIVRTTSGLTPTVEITVNAIVPSTFMKLAGIKEMPVKAKSKAGFNELYSTVYALIDMSESMGIAANDSERAKLEALTSPYYSGGCAFGCHWRDGWEPAGKTVNQMAREAGIKLREDVLESAFGNFVDTFLDPSQPGVSDGRQMMGVYGFSDSAKLLQTPSNSASVVKSAPTTFPDGQRWNTLYSKALPSILDDLGTQGNGTPGNPIKTILLITDGVGWNRNSADTSENGVVPSKLCDDFKAAGYTVAVLEVQYQDATGEYWYDTLVSPFYSTVSLTLQACASPGYYFLASDSDAKSLAQAFNDAAKSLRSQLALKN